MHEHGTASRPRALFLLIGAPVGVLFWATLLHSWTDLGWAASALIVAPLLLLAWAVRAR